MKYKFHIIAAFSAFIIGVAACSAWLAFYYVPNQISVIRQTEPTVAPPVGAVTFRFLECAGKRSVFLLENQTERPIFARFQRADDWKEWKDANIHLGLHLIDYKASDDESFRDISARWDAVMPFKKIPSQTTVRYGVELARMPGQYKIRVPYLDNPEVAQRFDQDFLSKDNEKFERNLASVKVADSGIILNRCQ
jgi:hypothetical protein